MKRKIIIDTDPGQDDAMALMLACASPELEVQAVTTVCGNSTIENTTRNARFILDYLGRSDIPVYSGARKPLRRSLIQAIVHGTSGLEGVDPTNESKLSDDAVEKILQLAQTNPHELTLVALGPLTNIARAIQQDPQTMKLLKELVIMGGAISVPGNQSRVAEFNFFTDPEAADIVMRFPVPKVLIPLDACNQVTMRLADLKRIKAAPLRELLETMFRPYIANLAKDTGVAAAIMYDPLTVFYLLEPSSCEAVDYNVLIETRGAITRGMTVVDKRKVPDGAKANASVVVNANAQSFIDAFIRKLNTYTNAIQ